MDRQAHDYAAAMAFAQQQQQYGFHPQPQQFPQQVHGPPYLQHHPSIQQFPYHLPQQQLYPPHHHPLLHLQQQQQPPPSAFPPHLPSQIHSPSPFMHPFDSAPTPAAPPSDPELHKTIDKLVEYAVKNGPEFEAMIREKQQDNPAYGFLFGAEGHGYYRYKLWLTARASTPAFNPSFPSSVPMMPSHNSVLNASPPLAAPQLHQHSFPPSFDHHQQPLNSQSFLGQARSDYGSPNNYFKGLSGPLPSDVATELNAVLSNLNGTKESIKGAKMWFMQRSPFAPALAEALRDRIFALDDSERQLHIIFLANDILFDSLQRRVSPHELDNEALAFKPVMGQMLARVYNNPHNKDENQSRMEKILGFWASKEVYDSETISSLEKEMADGLPMRSLTQKDAPGLTEPSSFTGLQTPSRWKLDPQIPLPGSLDHKETNRMQLPLVSQFGPPITQQFPPNHPITSQTSFLETQTASLPLLSHLLPPGVGPAITDQAPPPYPLFPPGLIPGMVRKMQIGSGVPYSPLSPLDIPTVIPPSSVSPSEILERVSKFFKEIGEVNPSEGPMDPNDGDVDGGDEREPPARKGGACIPPPRNLQVDPETGMYEDGSVDRKPGSSGRLGLGATADPNEASQYDDVYSSYRKQRSSNYHTSMSTRAAAK